MDKLLLRNLKTNLVSEKGKTVVLLFDPRDELIDETVYKTVEKIEPKAIVIDFQQYDPNNRVALTYLYADVYLYIKNIIKNFDENFNRIMEMSYEEGLYWIKEGSHVPISNLLRNFIEEHIGFCGRPPVIVMANIDVETQINHATIGTIVFDIITSPISANVIITCTPEIWKKFAEGRDIFSRVASRLRSCVKLIDKTGV